MVQTIAVESGSVDNSMDLTGASSGWPVEPHEGCGTSCSTLTRRPAMRWRLRVITLGDRGIPSGHCVSSIPRTSGAVDAVGGPGATNGATPPRGPQQPDASPGGHGRVERPPRSLAGLGLAQSARLDRHAAIRPVLGTHRRSLGPKARRPGMRPGRRGLPGVFRACWRTLRSLSGARRIRSARWYRSGSSRSGRP